MNSIQVIADINPKAPETLKGLGLVHGHVRSVLRAEGAMVALVAAMAYRSTGASWVWFAALFFAPDVSFVGYLAGKRAGTALYNLLHSYLLPLSLVVIAVRVSRLMPFALIWIAHIGFDRCVGYGLKYSTGFGDTHLGKMGSGPSGGV